MSTSLLKLTTLLVGASSLVSAFSTQFAFDYVPEVENRTLDAIAEAAIQEGGVVTVWHGGDETNQQDSLKQAFEARFPGMTLNLTVDLSKYLDGNLDQQLATGTVNVDSIVLQTLHDFPRWKEEGALALYQPLNFDQVYDQFKDEDGAYNAFYVFTWSNVWNTKFLNGTSPPKEYTDYLKPEFKDKLILTYPNDDDAVLYQFNLILNQYGYSWFEALLAQNPRWVRGTATPADLLAVSNGTSVATFTTLGAFTQAPLNYSYPTQGTFVSWPQIGAILKDAPHPQGARLFHSWVLAEYQAQMAPWTVRRDVAPPQGYPPIMEMPATDPTKFSEWMADRAAVERLRFFFEKRLGTAQGLSPLIDGQ